MSTACTAITRSLVSPGGQLRPLFQRARRHQSSFLCRRPPVLAAGVKKTAEAWGPPPLRCSHGDASTPAEEPSSSTSFEDQEPPQEAVLKAISEVSKSEGRIAHTTNVVIGGTVTDDSSNEWLALDQKVNSYPTVRGFTAIGTGGDDFVQAMVVAVESVLQEPIPKGRVSQKMSSRGKYVSVNIGPIKVVSSEQVQAIYVAMRRDNRMKYFL